MTDSRKNPKTKLPVEQLKTALAAMPDAFIQHPELFELLELRDVNTDGQKNLASFIERQVEVLKQRIQQQQQQTKAMIRNAKHSEFITARLFQITHELTACVSIDDIFDVLYQDTLSAFDIDFLSIKINRKALEGHKTAPKQLAEISCDLEQDSGYHHVLQRVNGGNSLCSDRFPDDVIATFFADHVDELKSAAFVPLVTPHTSDCFGILGLGSAQTEKFSNQLSGTLHLDRFGTLAATAIDRALKAATNS